VTEGLKERSSESRNSLPLDENTTKTVMDVVMENKQFLKSREEGGDTTKAFDLTVKLISDDPLDPPADMLFQYNLVNDEEALEKQRVEFEQKFFYKSRNIKIDPTLV
jgi:hypothetical protein